MCLKQRLMMKQVSTNSIPELSNSNALCLFISNFSFNVIAGKELKEKVDVSTQTPNQNTNKRQKNAWGEKLWTLLLNVDLPEEPDTMARRIINDVIGDVVRNSDECK
jgi:hypothetical protein